MPGYHKIRIYWDGAYSWQTTKGVFLQRIFQIICPIFVLKFIPEICITNNTTRK